MKNRKHIGLWVILFFLVVLGALGFWQRENIRAAIIYLRTDEASSAQQMEENRENVQSALKEQYNVTVLPPTLEQSDALLSGALTPEEVKESLGLLQKPEDVKITAEPSQSEETKETLSPTAEPEETKETSGPTAEPEETKETSGPTAGPEETKETSGPTAEPEETKETLDPDAEPVESKDSSSESQQTEKIEQSAAPVQTPEGEKEEQKQTKTPQMIVDECITELYAAEIDLMAVLGTMKQAAIEEWNSLPYEQRTTAKMKKIILDGLNQCYTLEVEIDSLVKSILEKYRVQMKEINGDLTVFDKLWNYYCDEKASTKAYYMNKYL